jgi:trehalose 6-phosphate phosphatase
VADALDALRADPSLAAVLTDFDGTLSPIVDDPSAAAPLPGVVDVLASLAARYAVVGVISGRPVSYLLDRLGPDLWLSGLYGLEEVEDGRRIESPAAADWRPAVDAMAVRATEVFGEEVVEHKGLSLTLHFRTRPEIGPDVRRWSAEQAAASGLETRSAKASVELHPPVRVDKGTVVERAAADARAVCFLGDDVGDLPAFDALDRLAGRGIVTVRVAVETPEAPVEVLERADLVVDGPDGALALLRSL